jgi:hypothetical protein
VFKLYRSKTAFSVSDLSGRFRTPGPGLVAPAAAGRRHHRGPASMPVGRSSSAHAHSRWVCLMRLPLSYIRLTLLELIRVPRARPVPARCSGSGPPRCGGSPEAPVRVAGPSEGLAGSAPTIELAGLPPGN